MREPLLSIIIISYENSSLILRRAIQSVLEQSYKNYEVILVDANKEGSAYSLGLREDMEKYPEIPVISCPSKRGEFAAAKNQGAEQANGTYLAFLMAGDAWNQECASSQIEVLEENSDIALAFCQSWQQEDDALSVCYKTAPEPAAVPAAGRASLSQEAIHSVSQAMFRRTAFEDMFGFDTRIHKQDDYDMWIRLAQKHKIASIDRNLVCSYVDKTVLKKTHRLIDVVGYLQLYSKHYKMYRKNPAARYELYLKIEACYRNEKYYLAWFKYAVRIRVLEMRLGRKNKKDAAETNEVSPSYDMISSQDKEYIAVVKRMDGGTPGIGLPEEGAEFQIYLKSAGSYDEAKTNEKDTIICDKDGYAKSKALSQGIYVVHQTKGQSKTELSEKFEITLNREGKTHTVALISSPESFYVRVVRKDSETGRIIPLSGGAYRITDSEGQPVSMTVMYPEPMLLETFSTGDKGYFITPAKLVCGDYTISEIKAPYGYAKNGKVIPFTVSKELTEEENGVAMITVVTEDTVQKGRILLHKNGPVIRKVTTEENTLRNAGGYPVGGSCIYTPHYEQGDVEGAVFEITAAEDIVTAEGTLRVPKNTVICTVTTDSAGDAVISDLYPGKYCIVEKKAAGGLLRNQEIQEAEIVYDDSGAVYADITVTSAGERQKVSVYLEKTLGEDNIFGIGKQGEIRDFIFGLFAAEDIHMSDGSVIPQDGLIEILRCDEEGKASSSSELPCGNYYVKEIMSNGHYRCSDICYPVRYAYQDQDREEVRLYVNDGRPLTSEMIRGTIRGIKTDQHNHPLAMAEIGLFPIGAADFSKDSAVLVSVTDWNGAFAFNDIPCGDYIVRELKAPQGYIMNEAMYYISLTYDEQRIDLKLINQSL